MDPRDKPEGDDRFGWDRRSALGRPFALHRLHGQHGHASLRLAVVGECAAALRTRRADLVNYLLRVYRYYAAVVDIHATDKNERVAIVRNADGSLDVTMASADRLDAPYYRRHFVPAETQEMLLKEIVLAPLTRAAGDLTASVALPPLGAR